MNIEKRGSDMSNMGYCRFENTVSDLEDCYEHLDDKLSAREASSRLELIEICRKIVNESEQIDFDKLTKE